MNRNPWERDLSSEENSILYYIFKQIAYMIDYMKNIPTYKDKKKNNPRTNLRNMCNYYNFTSTSAIFIIIFYAIYIVIHYIFNRGSNE